MFNVMSSKRPHFREELIPLEQEQCQETILHLDIYSKIIWLNNSVKTVFAYGGD